MLVTQKTVFHIAEKGEVARGITHVAFEDIGGLKEEIQKVREMIELPLRHPEIFEKLEIEAPKEELLHGPPVTDKTLLANAATTLRSWINTSRDIPIDMNQKSIFHTQYFCLSVMRTWLKSQNTNR